MQYSGLFGDKTRVKPLGEGLVIIIAVIKIKLVFAGFADVPAFPADQSPT